MSSIVSFVFLQALLAQVAFSQERRDTPECPGVWYSNDSGSGCCVGGNLPPVILSTCAGWPICTGPVTTTTTETPISCATIISESESGYSSKISAAESSMSASGTHYPSGLTIANAAENTATTGAAASSVGSATATVTTTRATSTRTAASASATGSNSGSAVGVSNVLLPAMLALAVGFLGAAACL